MFSAPARIGGARARGAAARRSNRIVQVLQGHLGQEAFTGIGVDAVLVEPGVALSDRAIMLRAIMPARSDPYSRTRFQRRERTEEVPSWVPRCIPLLDWREARNQRRVAISASGRQKEFLEAVF